VAPDLVVSAPHFVECRKMCHNVHMKVISIRELHLETGRWVRKAGHRSARIVVTDRGRPLATLVPYASTATQARLPDREREIRALSRIDVDSAEVVSSMRDRG
jgi:prevent-host-death family protein